jgi:hypothetical protein
MRVEFYRPDAPERVVATARWDDRAAAVDAPIEGDSALLEAIFRPTPIVVADDPSLRSMGARGEVVVRPGTLEWFRTAALVRSASQGLAARIVPEITGQGGWDPASAYRTFRQSVDGLARRGVRQPAEASPQIGETTPSDRSAALGSKPEPGSS